MTTRTSSGFFMSLSLVILLAFGAASPVLGQKGQMAPGGRITSDHGYVERAHLVRDTGDALQIGNIRWGVMGKNPTQTPPEEHEFNWNTATVRPALVDQMFFLVKPFRPKIVAGHGYVVMLFRQGGFVDAHGNEPEGLVISYEIFKKPGMKVKDIDFVYKATHDYYEVAPVLATWEDYIMADCELGGHEILPFRIHLTQAQMQQFARTMLLAAANNAPGQEFYHTLRNSCVTKQVHGLNAVLPPEKQINITLGQTKILNVNGFVPKRIAKTFVKHGVMTGCEPSITRKNFFVPLRKLYGSSSPSPEQGK